MKELSESQKREYEIEDRDSPATQYILQLKAERDEIRDVLEWYSEMLWDGREPDGFDFHDEMVKRGLFVEVKASDRVREEYDTETMFTWKWHADKHEPPPESADG